jgi:hypothetical protein
VDARNPRSVRLWKVVTRPGTKRVDTSTISLLKGLYRAIVKPRCDARKVQIRGVVQCTSEPLKMAVFLIALYHCL